MRRVDKEYQKVSSGIKQDIVGHYAYQVASSEGYPVIYEVKDFRAPTNEVILRRVFDNNGVLLDDAITKTINQVSAAGESTFFSKFCLMHRSEE